MQKAIIICGPTASGKTGFGHSVAKKHVGEIINIDAIQIYKQLSIVTASPETSLRSEVEYHLYNFLDISQKFSVIEYVNLAKDVINKIFDKGKLPILVGGTGMYINALINGYNAIPNIPDNVRKKAKDRLIELGNEEFFRELCTIDENAAQRLKANDSQRILRAYEVITHTNKSIFTFQSDKNILPLPNVAFQIVYLLPDRIFLHQMIEKRLEYMFKNGAIDEVQQCLQQCNKRQIAPSALKAIGAREIIEYLEGNITLDQAKELTLYRSRQYAKRQITWFNNQLQQKDVINFSSQQEYDDIIKHFNLNLRILQN